MDVSPNKRAGHTPVCVGLKVHFSAAFIEAQVAKRGVDRATVVQDLAALVEQRAVDAVTFLDGIERRVESFSECGL